MRNCFIFIASPLCLLASSIGSGQQPALDKLGEAERILKSLRSPSVPLLHVKLVQEKAPTDKFIATLVANYWRMDYRQDSVFVFAFYSDKSLRFVIAGDYEKASAKIQMGGEGVATGTWRISEEGTVDFTYTTNYRFVDRETTSASLKIGESEVTVMYVDGPRTYRAVKK
jgi:hypothetical protein